MRRFIVFAIIFVCYASVFADPPFDTSNVTIEKPSLRKYDYESGSDVIYYGYNSNPDASDADTDWVVFKFTYVSSNVTQIERRTGDWTGRANLY